MGEIRDEEGKAHRDTELIGELLIDLSNNLQKITHHGGRASAIVKGMLEHSRTGSGEKRPTDLNALADEYLKIAYHGMRANDKADSTIRFNADLITDFDPKMGQVAIIPQEIGRVLLNLYNNAFYAVQERDKQEEAKYQPTVTVTTRLVPHSPERALSIANPNGVAANEIGINGVGAYGVGTHANGLIEIRVSDNGTGMPKSVKAKVFQPFFTTKPTGEGTGLGLSLSYDIITRGHGGTLTVESREGTGAEFVVRLPMAKL